MVLGMSMKERDRLKVLQQVSEGRISQKFAAERLGLSVRQTRRLQKAYEAEGDAGLVHKSRGRPSNRRVSGGVWQRVKRLMRTKCVGFGPSLACEHLSQEEGIHVGRESLRKRMRAWNCDYSRRRLRPHRKQRPRREHFGDKQ